MSRRPARRARRRLRRRSGSRRGFRPCAGRACRRRRARRGAWRRSAGSRRAARQLVHAQLAVAEQVEDANAHRLADRAKAAGDQFGEIFGQWVRKRHSVGYPLSQRFSCISSSSMANANLERGASRVAVLEAPQSPLIHRRAADGGRADRATRRLGRRPPAQRLRSAGQWSRSHWRSFAPQVETRAVRRGLAGKRLRVGRRAHADPAELRRALQLRPDGRAPLVLPLGRRPGVPEPARAASKACCAPTGASRPSCRRSQAPRSRRTATPRSSSPVREAIRPRWSPLPTA